MTNPQANSPQQQQNKLIELIQSLIGPLGYEVVHIEVQTHHQKTLRVFIDFSEASDQAVGIEDCVKVTKALDEPLDQDPELERIFKGNYELEVSSPGTDRPLRLPKDYDRFSGREARIHVFRPLSAEELGNAEYQKRNPKQKNFLGVLNGMQGENVRVSIDGKSEISIPLTLISKANLEPKFDFDREED